MMVGCELLAAESSIEQLPMTDTRACQRAWVLDWGSSYVWILGITHRDSRVEILWYIVTNNPSPSRYSRSSELDHRTDAQRFSTKSNGWYVDQVGPFNVFPYFVSLRI